MRWVLAVLLGLCLSACASVPLRTMYNLWNFDPWSSDFRAWRAGARLPLAGAEAIKPQIRMTIATWTDEKKDRREETFVLLPTSEPVDLQPLTSEMRAGYSLSAYRIDPNDYARLAALRTRIVAAKTAGGPQLHGSLSIGARGCGGFANVPKGPFLVSTYLLVDRKDGYNPLIVDYDLADAIRKAPPAPAKDAC